MVGVGAAALTPGSPSTTAAEDMAGAGRAPVWVAMAATMRATKKDCMMLVKLVMLSFEGGALDKVSGSSPG